MACAGAGKDLPFPESLERALLEVKAHPSLCRALIVVRVDSGRSPGAERAALEAEFLARLRRSVRSRVGCGRQDLVCRLGRGEFAVLTAPLRSVRDAEAIGARLLQRLEPPAGSPGAGAGRRVRLGLVVLRPEHRSVAQVLAEARQAAERRLRTSLVT